MKLRIISGTLGGRFIEAPRGRGTRPTAARVREAWFSALGAVVEEARVVDLCAGSGALGIEALSRGARHVHFVESAGSVCAVIRRNLEALNLVGRSTVTRADSLRFVERIEDTLDLAFADPPYQSGLGEHLLGRFRERAFADGFWLEHDAGDPLSEEADWTRRYGDTAVSAFLARPGNAERAMHTKQEQE